MAMKLIDDSIFTAIANAIRGKLGGTTKYKPGEMAAAISSIPEAEEPIYDTPSITVSTGGLITASANGKTATKQLTTQAGTTITPTKSTQTAVASGRYTTGAVSVGPIPASYIVPSGSETITENKTLDVTNLASVTVAIPIQHYYTGSAAPSSSLGVSGDIYLQS